MLERMDVYDRYSDEVQNLGRRMREHEAVDQLLKKERSIFGFNEGTLRRLETLSRVRDDNGFESDET